MNKRARCGVAPPGDVFYAFRQTPTRSLSLFEYYKERRRKNRNEEGQNIRKTKKKSRVDRLVFNFLWVFCRPKMSLNSCMGKKIININE